MMKKFFIGKNTQFEYRQFFFEQHSSLYCPRSFLKEGRKMKKETLSMLSGCVAFAMVFSLGAPMAQAAAGNIDNARINGSWNYSWTKSTASVWARKPAYTGYAQACQDGVCFTGHTTQRIQSTTAVAYGSASNHTDSARVWG